MNKQNDLEARRHSLAHLLAAAVLNLYPEAKLAIGPAIDTGFYYDFDLPKTISDKDLPRIEQEMKKLLPTWHDFRRQELTPEQARNIYRDNPYKLELIEELTATGQVLTTYESGPMEHAFIDLCAGGHIDDLATIPPDSFKLERVAGAYWRGDEKNKMLIRIYGLAFADKQELEQFISHRAEAEKRDHRKLGKELDLFTFSDLVGSGLPLFTPKGTLMRNLIMDKINTLQSRFGYEQVTIPHITKKDLYETSGHWEKFKDDLFRVTGMSETEFVMKPMNCPHHTQIYAGKMRSYKELPIRFAETTMVYRDEQAGELLGLARVRSITQDDGHVFCTFDQIENEIGNIITVIKEFYSTLGMFREGNYWVSLSVRDSKKLTDYLGEEKIWDQAEKILENAARHAKLDFKRVEGEAAFYGPKLDFMFKDSLGRERQLATAQLDFVMPERFDLTYVGPDGKEERPVMIHRAIAGSLERFMAIMIEHFAGAFPFWLSPIQVKIIPIGDKHSDYAKEIAAQLREKNVRIELDENNDTLGKKIRTAKMQKVPYLFVLGDKEMTDKKITVEDRDSGQSTQMTLAEFLDKIETED
ncbi:MAG: threonine--tRNA ligase [Candidatus Paceibacterota bacterium]